MPCASGIDGAATLPMKRCLPFLFTLLPGLLGAVEFHVAPSGRDTDPGTEQFPFASVERARDAVRALKQAGPLREPVRVVLRGGTYRLAAPLEFTPDDSGTVEAPVTYAAAPGARPVISGGQEIQNWRVEPGVWKAVVPGVKEGRWNFQELFINGERRVRARTPNAGYLYTEGILAPFDRAKWWDPEIEAKRGFLFREGDLRRWARLEDARIVVYHSWTTSIHAITGLDLEARTVRLAPQSTWPIGYWWEFNTRYHVENIPEALDQPGEWYLDRTTGELSYLPLPGESLDRIEAVAPVVPQTLLIFRGVPERARFVEHLRLTGLSFQHTGMLFRPDMATDQQGATERAALLQATGLRQTELEDCEIAHAGENALWLDRGCQEVLIRRCHLHDLGGSGIFIGPKAYKDTPEERVERNVVENCFVHDGSHSFRGSQGVWIGKSSHNRVEHNEISDFHHIGISVGHSWGYAPSTAHHNRVAFNHVHHICNGMFSDGGAIYTLGVSPGTVIANNLIHDVVPTPQMPVGGTGIYHDEGSSGILVENNIVYRVGAGAYNQHYGKENLARNNIFAFGGKDTITCCRPEEHLSFTFEGNIVLSSLGQIASDHYSPLKCRTVFRRNLYWDISGKEPLFSGRSFADWQKTGRDAGSRIADPLFGNPGAGDFRLREGSPALAMGFRPVAVEEIGLQGSPEWRNAPAQVRRAALPAIPAPPPPPAPPPLVLDFEGDRSGGCPGGFTLSPPERPELIAVVEADAAAGRRCLRMTRAAGLEYSFQPHIWLSSKRYEGRGARFSCDLRNSGEHPAEIYLGLRDWSVPDYREGPSLLWKTDGALCAGNRELTRLPPGRWVRFEIMLAPAAKTYQLSLSGPGASRQVFDDLPCANPRFEQLTWIGLSCLGQTGAVFELDNFDLRPESTKPSHYEQYP